MKFVDVTNDIAFRKIFGNQNKKIALISFLNAVLYLPADKKVVDVTILNTYQLPKLRLGRATIVDVKAKDQHGNTFIVEMQVSESADFTKRVLYYTSQSYISQIERGDLYHKLTPVFFIGILAFKATGNPSYINRHKVLDVETGENVIADIDFTFIELPKFNLKDDEVKTIVEQWVYFIKNAENLDVIPENITDEGLIQAFEEADKHSWTKQELEEYDYMFMREQDERGKYELAMKRALEAATKQPVDIATAKTALETAKTLIEGKIEIARKLLERGMDMAFIIETTGLTKEEIEKFL